MFPSYRSKCTQQIIRPKPVILAVDSKDKEQTEPSQTLLTHVSSVDGNNDLDDNEFVNKQVCKQNKARFDPFNHFGANQAPKIGS